jgi:hypothetical protein
VQPEPTVPGGARAVTVTVTFKSRPGRPGLRVTARRARVLLGRVSLFEHRAGRASDRARAGRSDTPAVTGPGTVFKLLLGHGTLLAELPVFLAAELRPA